MWACRELLWQPKVDRTGTSLRALLGPKPHHMDRKLTFSHSRSSSNITASTRHAFAADLRLLARPSELGSPSLACREYSPRPEAYELLEECGRGVSATVGPITAALEPVQSGTVGISGDTFASTARADELSVWQVWRARCKTFDEVVAIKLLDLENVNCSLVSNAYT